MWTNENERNRLLFVSIAVAACGLIVLDGIYQLIGLSPAACWIVFLIALGTWMHCLRGVIRWRVPRIPFDMGIVLLVISAVADAVIVVFMMLARTDAALISPWNLYTWEPFVLLAVSTILLFVGARMHASRFSVLAGMWHTFAMVSVSALVYGVGFGFDPFLHRAAEEELAAHGFIEPRQWLYSGQYVLVTALHYLSGISIKTIDVWLVPILTSVFLPLGAVIGLRDGWGLSDRDARSWWMVAFLQPFMLLTFTVPFTWTYVWYLTLLFLLPAAKSPLAWGALVLGSVAMALFHPLLAIPTGVLVVGFGMWQWSRGRVSGAIALGFLASMTAGVVPALFVVYQHAQGVPVSIEGFVSRFERFAYLFYSPFTHPYPLIPWHLEFIYDLRYWFPMIGMGVGVVLMLVLVRRTPVVRPYLAFSVGLMGAIFAVSTLFHFRDIIEHEQAEFALRLLTAWYLIPLPVFAVVLARLTNRFRFMLPIAIVLVSGMIVHAWFFSYPQFNLKYPFFSPSVSAADVEAVHAIDERAKGEEYLVLSNQMTSAAAIQEFHFATDVTYRGEEVLWYAIPTGGPLYAVYTQAIYEGPKRELFDTLAADTGVAIIYFVIHDYWPWYPGFVEELERGADHVIHVQGNAIRVYEYRYAN